MANRIYRRIYLLHDHSVKKRLMLSTDKNFLLVLGEKRSKPGEVD